MNLQAGPRAAGVAAATTTAKDLAAIAWGRNEKTIVGIDKATALGTVTVNFKIINGAGYQLGGVIDLTTATNYVVIDVPGVVAVQLVPASLTGEYGYQINGFGG